LPGKRKRLPLEEAASSLRGYALFFDEALLADGAGGILYRYEVHSGSKIRNISLEQVDFLPLPL
jgi:hypothetical protein